MSSRPVRGSWFYRSPLGTFWIRAHPTDGAFVLLGIGGRPLGAHVSPASAADDVARHATGWPEWDARGDVTPPRDITEWERVEG